MEGGDGIVRADPHTTRLPEANPLSAQEARAARLPSGSVSIPTYVNVITAAALSSGERAERTRQVERQVNVLNRAYSGNSASDAVDTPFRFTLRTDQLRGERQVGDHGVRQRGRA